MVRVYSYQTDEKVGPNEGRIRRNIISRNGLTTVLPNNIRTLWDFIPHISKKYGPKRAIGSRRILKVVNKSREIQTSIGPQTQTLQFYELGPYEYINFTEFALIIQTLGAGFRSIGLKPFDRLQIFARTSARWMTTALGAISQSLTITTAYDTLGEDGLIHSLQQTEAKAIYTESDLVIKLLNVCCNTPSVQYVIYSGEPDPEELETFQQKYPELRLFSYDEIIRRGRENPVDPTVPSPDDLACIMYTSGSTGDPKGVKLTHRNIVAAIAAFDLQMSDCVNPSDYLLCFLPLAHILEFAFEIIALYWGTTLGYASIKTLTDANVINCKGDLQEFRPTVMFGVPAVWEMVRKGVTSQVNNSNILKKGMFWGAYHLKNALIKANLPGKAILDALVFRKVKRATGGRLKFILSGGAQLAESTRKFVQVCFCQTLIGYGLTETCATAALTHPSQYNSQTIGPPLPCLEIKLVDVPESDYYASRGGQEQGEIYIRGDSVAVGYFMNDEANREAYDGEWFRTGDIGEWMPNGHIRIIDRRKNIVKTLLGEYIALEKLESIYRSCQLVNNICVYADPQRRKPIAIVVPHEANLRKAAYFHKLIPTEDEQWDKICNNPNVQKYVWIQLLEVGHVAKLKSMELIQGVVLCSEEFTVENKMVTSVQKLQRRIIQNVYKKQIEKAYLMGE